MPLIIGSLCNIFLLVDVSIFFRSTDQLMEPGYGSYSVCGKITKLDIIKTRNVTKWHHTDLWTLSLSDNMFKLGKLSALRNLKDNLKKWNKKQQPFSFYFYLQYKIVLEQELFSEHKKYCWMQTIVLQADFPVSKHRISLQASRSQQALCI